MTTQTEGTESVTDPVVSPRETTENSRGLGPSIGKLISTKLKILAIESKVATWGILRVVVLIATAVVLLFFTWVLLMAGLIGMLVEQTGLTWFYAAFAIAGVHFLVAIILALVAKSTPPALFQHTAAEFHKDKEWLFQLKNNWS
jgi:uncharacterized membrane protein YqjE